VNAHPGDVFEGEQRGEDPFDAGQQHAVTLVDAGDAVEHHHHQAGEDPHQQPGVESPAGVGIGEKNDGVQAFAPVHLAQRIVIHPARSSKAG